MFNSITQVVNGLLILAVCLLAIFLAMKSQARTWRLLGWFACIMSLTLVMIEGYGWYRRGDWQVRSAFDLWNEMQRSSVIWLNNTLPSAIWEPINFILDFPAWLVLGVGGILLLLLDHRQIQRNRVGAKPAPLLKRLKELLLKPQKEGADKA
ncbi:MAG: hypothetical protein ACKVOI_05535 [Dongiaceae bacterium]